MRNQQAPAISAAPVTAAEALRGFATDIFARAGMPETDAAVVADVLVWANLRGVDTHGVMRIPRYVDLIETGDMNARPAITIRTETPASVLIEADLMRRVLDAVAFGDWLARFLPGIAQRDPAALFTPAVVSNRCDPHIVHLDGLNLSRAWCWRAIAAALPAGDSRVAIATVAADVHQEAGLRGVGSGEYGGDHWLATFAVLALSN